MTTLQTKQEELAKKLEEVKKLEAEIEELENLSPVFYDPHGVVSALDDKTDEKLKIWLRTRARIIEKINIANKGDNGFKANSENITIELRGGFFIPITDWKYQKTEPMLIIRSQEGVRNLLRDLEFIEDLRTYFAGWL